MNLYRSNQIYVSNEVRYYIGLRRKQLIGENPEANAGITDDEICNADLQELYTQPNPKWVVAWEKREELRQKHKKDLELVEAEAVKVVES